MLHLSVSGVGCERTIAARGLSEIFRMNDPVEILMRVACAALAGICLGLNRWLHHKSAGVKTHALVAIGSATAVMVVLPGNGFDGQVTTALEASSRVVQGILAGIGFLGAGVIMHNARGKRIQGLTTAASIWTTTVLGAAFGRGLFIMPFIALAAVGLSLLTGNWLEQKIGKLMNHDPSNADEEDRP